MSIYQWLCLLGIPSIITLLIGFTGIAPLFSLPVMPIVFLAWMAGLMVVYTVLAQAMKVLYIRINKEWV